MTTATTVNINPSKHVKHENRNIGIKGAAPDFQEINDIKVGMGDTVIENLDINEGEYNVKKVNALGGLNAGHDKANNCNTRSKKSKPKWTRVPNMEYGPGIEEGEAVSILGKKEAAHRVAEEVHCETLVQVLKRNKTQGDYSMDIATRVMDHPF